MRLVPAPWHMPAVDYDGDLRIANGTVDLGAFERQPGEPIPALSPGGILAIVLLMGAAGAAAGARRRRAVREYRP